MHHKSLKSSCSFSLLSSVPRVEARAPLRKSNTSVGLGFSFWCRAMEAAVVDPGSSLLKAGFAIPDQAPAMIIPTQMKRMLDDGSMTDNLTFDDIAVDPVCRGYVRDWDALEDLLHYVLYTGLGWEMGNEGQILFTDPLCTPKANKEQLVQLMFETFNISGFYASEQAVLSLYAVGRISGCTVDIGHGKIDIAPVIEGAVNHIASRRFEFGGVDLTNFLAQELGKSNPLVNISISDVEKIKQQYSCCAEDELAYQKTKGSCPVETHTLPDGQSVGAFPKEPKDHFMQHTVPNATRSKDMRWSCWWIALTRTIWQHRNKLVFDNQIFNATKLMDEALLLIWSWLKAMEKDFDTHFNQWSSNLADAFIYTVGEALFQPCLLGLEAHGIVEQLVRTISTVSSDNHRQLLENTVVCGGTSSMTGFEERFQKESSQSSSAIRPTLVKPPEYMPENLTMNSAWVGGAILAKVVFPQNQHVTKADYDETGPSIVHRKCF
ncbi:Actin-related protein 7 [Glycine max]|nr:Actin-related protein 7 [Glycine max]